MLWKSWWFWEGQTWLAKSIPQQVTSPMCLESTPLLWRQHSYGSSWNYYVFICISYILTCELFKTLSSDSKQGSQWQIGICDRLPVDLYKKVILVIHLTNKSFMLLDFLALNAGTLYLHIHQILLYVLYDFSLEKSHLWETSVS